MFMSSFNLKKTGNGQSRIKVKYWNNYVIEVNSAFLNEPKAVFVIEVKY